MLVNPLNKIKNENLKAQLKQSLSTKCGSKQISETAGINIVSEEFCPVCNGQMEPCMSIEGQKVRTCIGCAVSIPYVGD